MDTNTKLNNIVDTKKSEVETIVEESVIDCNTEEDFSIDCNTEEDFPIDCGMAGDWFYELFNIKR